MELCFLCKDRLKLNTQEGCCKICKDDSILYLYNLRNTKPFVPENVKTFYIQGESMEQYENNEELFFDFSLGQSIKVWANKIAIKKIAELTGLKPKIRDPDIVYKIKFPDGITGYELGNIYIYGKYKKLKEGISQKRWKKYSESVESIIGERAKRYFNASQYYLHCSGREDVDVINIGKRPFVIELIKPEKRYIELKPLENLVNEYGKVNIELKGYVPSTFVELVSNSHFDKLYRAYIDQELNENEIKLIKNFKGVINQQTPLRVMHRRANKLRKRKIYNIDVGKDEQGIYLEIYAESGTYIKEFINSDKGRTKPSISEMLGKEVNCKKLIVKDIKSGFLDFIFEKQKIIS
jgi:tRNA pseudouridine synthase 10